MSSRSFRLETRSRARDEIKRIMQTVEKVRKWEKIWIETGLSNHLKVYKWVPVREENKESVKEDDQTSHKENQQSVAVQSPAQTSADPLLPEILSVKERSSALETPHLSTDQLPPDLLLASDETLSSDRPATATADGGVAMATGGSAATSNVAGGGDGDSIQQEVDLEKRLERQAGGHGEEENSRPRSRSPH